MRTSRKLTKRGPSKVHERIFIPPCDGERRRKKKVEVYVGILHENAQQTKQMVLNQMAKGAGSRTMNAGDDWEVRRSPGGSGPFD
jgi:hypothetical protein